jgi:hypothetical protein
MTNLHTPICWGGILVIFGVLYVVKFSAGRASK